MLESFSDTIKNLETIPIAKGIIVLGLVRELRLFIQFIIEYKIKTRK